MARRNRTAQDCALWYCTQCDASGTLTMDGESDQLVFGCMASVEVAHRKQKPDCIPGDFRIIDPANWYEEAAELLRPQFIERLIRAGKLPGIETTAPRECLPYKDS